MMYRNCYIFSLWVSISALSSFSMQPPAPTKIGPVYIYNRTPVPIKIKEKRSQTPYEMEISIEKDKTWKIDLVTQPQTKNRNTAAVYDITVSVPGYNLIQPISIDHIATEAAKCFHQDQKSDVTVFIDLEMEKGWVSNAYKLKTSFECTGSTKELHKNWQKIISEAASKEINIADEEEVNPKDTGEQPKLLEDIKQLHPTLSNSRTLLDNLREQSMQELPHYRAYEASLFKAGQKKIDNPLFHKIQNLVAIAKHEKLLADDYSEFNDYTPNHLKTGFEDNNTKIFFAHGYIHCYSTKFMAPTAHLHLPDYIAENNRKSPQAEQFAAELVKTYKIHLMPEYNWIQITAVAEVLMHVLMTHAELQKIIAGFKVRVAPFIVKPNGGEIIMPLIVIYIFSGKENTQKVLDILYDALKGKKGLGITPRHNVVINDLIFAAQGDGQYKGGIYSEYYEQPREAYYREDFTPKGKNKGYHLHHPETKADLE